MRGINGTAKREEGVDVFRGGEFELLALTKTKLKGNGKVSWCGINSIITGAQEMERARAGLAILMKRDPLDQKGVVGSDGRGRRKH